MNPTAPDGSPNSPHTVAWGVQVKHESLWPARLASIATVLLYLTLPDKLTVGPNWIPPLLEVLLLIPLTIIAPVRHYRNARTQRWLSFALITLINLANIGSLGLLIYALLHKGAVPNGKTVDGVSLLGASLQIWLTNVLVFALWYWFLDRGGPIQRRLMRHPAPDFLFPQMATPDCSLDDWAPHFIDYLYVAFTNATAFSPTDTLPLTLWAKMLMMVQSFISLVTVALVAARAVNILA